jgi:hypothetical protein
MGALIEHVGEGPTPAAIADFFFKHLVGTMPVAPGVLRRYRRKPPPSRGARRCWREKPAR